MHPALHDVSVTRPLRGLTLTPTRDPVRVLAALRRVPGADPMTRIQ